MAGHRLFIDIPLPFTEEESLDKANKIIELLQSNKTVISALGAEQINYRLGHDEDRQTSNYFLKTSSGHVSNQKIKILLQESV